MQVIFYLLEEKKPWKMWKQKCFPYMCIEKCDCCMDFFFQTFSLTELPQEKFIWKTHWKKYMFRHGSQIWVKWGLDQKNFYVSYAQNNDIFVLFFLRGSLS